MEKYKGWEIAKMIYEEDLKEGDLIKSEYDDIFEIRKHHLIQKGGAKELGSSYFGGNFYYTIVQKPVSFMEVVEIQKRATINNDIIHKVYDKQMKYEDDDIYVIDIVQGLIEGKYYHLNDIIYAISGRMGCDDWEELIKNGEFYLEDKE